MKLPDSFAKITLSGAKSRGARADKIILRPVEIKGVYKIQAEEFRNNQAFHKNMDPLAAEKYLSAAARNFANVNIARGGADLSHDRTKNHIIREGVAIQPLIRLGIMDESGRVFKSKMDKFVQINNFLRILGDAVKNLPDDGVLEIVDFCCGKSYLTFVARHFFTEILKRDAHIVGIDAKADVIKNCREIKCDLKFDGLDLFAGDIRNFNPKTKIDVALSLHACDIATDIVLKKAAALGAKVILAAPCCHKQLAGQIKNGELDFMLKYGLLKERFAAIMTDALRANWLETQGYKVDMLEFVDYDNSPKNVMIRAVRTGAKSKDNLGKTAAAFGAKPEILK